MQTSPFYFAQRGANLVDIWHDNEACPLVQASPPDGRRRGVGYLRQRCPHCVTLAGPAPVRNWISTSAPSGCSRKQ